MTEKPTYEELEQRVRELEQAEKDKIETEKKFKAIFNHRFQLTGLLDINGKLLMANENVYNMVGVDSNEITGKYLWQLPHWSHSKEQQLKLKNAVHKVKKGNPISFETTHVDAKGDIKYIDFSLTPVHDDNGDLMYIVPEGKDITEKKQAENRLIESERNYRNIFNSGSDAISIHGTETGKIIDVNQTMLEMFGYTHPEILQLKIGDISSGESHFTQEEATTKIRKAVTAGPQLFEWMARHKNGTCFWVEVALRRTQIGGKKRVLAIVRDITLRKRQDSELKLAKLSIEHSAFPFEWIQKDARFIYVNEATCQSLGYTCEELCTMRVSDIDPDFQVESWHDFWDKLKSEKSLTFETNHRRKNGEIFPVEITANHLEIEGKEHVFAYVKDISDRVQYENEQKNLEKQLQQAQKMEAVGRLAGGVAHDFNNMLSVIIGYSEIILQKVDPSQSIYAELEQIRKAGERSADLTRQLLAFARKQTIAPKILNLNELVNDMTKMLKRLIGEDIDLAWMPGKDLWPVKIDPGQTDQILANLCINARDAIKGVGKITIETENCVFDEVYCAKNYGFMPGEYVLLAVSDNGSGMDKVTLKHLFEPFYTTKEPGKGTGLGLATVYGAVKQNKGFINVYSELSNGTTFKIYLPHHRKKAMHSIECGLLQPIEHGHETILVVEDEQGVLEMTSRILEGLGYTVVMASTPGKAISLARQFAGEIHLLMTDVVMPGMNGRDLAKNFLTIYPTIPVLFMSGYTDNVITHHGVLDEGVNFIHKPFKIQDLAIKVRQALDDVKR